VSEPRAHNWNAGAGLGETATTRKRGSMPEPGMQETMKRVQEATDRIRKGESDAEELVLPNGSVLRIFREEGSSRRVVVEAEKDGSVLRSVPFPAVKERPEGYPEDIPFLSNSACTLTEAGEGRARSMVWPAPSDPDAQFEAAHDQLLRMGWEEAAASEKDTEFGGVQSVDFMKDGAQRSLFLNRVGNQAQLMTVDHPPMKEEDQDPPVDHPSPGA
jgi:hypothetical protein